MSISGTKKSNQATDVAFANHMLTVTLKDGRQISTPLEWFPRLRDANEQQLANWRFIADGDGIHWDELDEDISVANLLV